MKAVVFPHRERQRPLYHKCWRTWLLSTWQNGSVFGNHCIDLPYLKYFTVSPKRIGIIVCMSSWTHSSGFFSDSLSSFKNNPSSKYIGIAMLRYSQIVMSWLGTHKILSRKNSAKCWIHFHHTLWYDIRVIYIPRHTWLRIVNHRNEGCDKYFSRHCWIFTIHIIIISLDISNLWILEYLPKNLFTQSNSSCTVQYG